MDDARREGRILRSHWFMVRRRHQLVRYAGVSVISTLTSLIMLGLLVGFAGVGAVPANLAATAAGTMPSFELNRRWVWSRAGRRSVGREVVPFCVLGFAGLLLSTVSVRAASVLCAHSGQLVHTGAVELANVGAYGSLWVLQFLLLDRVLFARRSSGLDRPLAAPCDPSSRIAEPV
jgi:putative flippase GtrA